MARTIMAVFTNPASPHVEDEYNSWYDEVHLKELLAVPGVVGATRYRLGDGAPSPSEHRYLALYELDGPPETVLAQLGSGAVAVSPTVDSAGARILFWEPIPGAPA
jgi:hypothetical protein